uniref:Uncharacterized protein n=1 Tax=Candidatus Kentrum sp. LPFa TaxID=2126335 RepID=A0A450X2T4_9GAMM|nr:MAG: hypothetical protein BECKLPF1236A_GA0070988_102922 [Candidatus Kentron sp. LPFa]VFK23595.1 MAG: hypothetical protein BECKLPF1236C_GA0070990_1000632 [Candidatus Kentron sp. LPFa]
MHPIEQKLKDEICPYLVTARRLNRWGPYWVYLGYSYLGELFVLLAGLGISNPIMSFLSDGQVKLESKDGTLITVVQFLNDPWAGGIALALLVMWALVKVYIRNENLAKRCSLLRSCQRQCIHLENQLMQLLPAPNPMKELINLQVKLGSLVEWNIVEESWRYGGPAPNINAQVNEYCSQLVSIFSAHWDQAPPNEQIEV